MILQAQIGSQAQLILRHCVLQAEKWRLPLLGAFDNQFLQNYCSIGD